MYFPYLRGRQYELIAIRELVEKSLISRKVIPVIEPVKLSSALIKTLRSSQERDFTLGLVRNPQVGDMLRDLKNDKNEKYRDQFYELLGTSNIMNFLFADANLSKNLSSIEDLGISKKDIATICINQEAIHHFESVYNLEAPRFNFMREESVFRRRMPRQRVLFEAALSNRTGM